MTKRKTSVQKSKKSGKSVGKYATANFVITISAWNYLDSLLTDFDEPTRQFYWHVLRCSNMRRHKTNGWVPIPYHGFIRKFFGRVDTLGLEEQGLLLREGYLAGSGDIEGICRSYKIPDEICQRVAELQLRDWEGSGQEPPERYNLVKNRRVTKAVVKSEPNANGMRSSKLVKEHIEAYGVCKFNRERAFHLLRLECRQIEVAEAAGDRQQIERLRGRHLNDSHGLMTVLNECGSTFLEGEIWLYKAPYKPQRSGRITHVEGGFQMVTREMQGALFGDLEATFNYDLKSSQPRAVCQLLEEKGLDSSWLRRYMADPEGKYNAAQAIGLSRDKSQTWKDCLNALLMGATVPKFKSTKQQDLAITREWQYAHAKSEAEQRSLKRVTRSGIVHYLAKAAATPEEACAVYRRFQNYVRPLKQVIDQWHELLEAECNPGRGKSEGYLKNAAGMKFGYQKSNESDFGVILLDDKNDQTCRPGGRIAAWRLQGLEGAFMGHLSKLQRTYGFRMMQNYHDGVITEGRIPQEAVEKAAAAAGLKECELEVKPLECPFDAEQSDEKDFDRGVVERVAEGHLRNYRRFTRLAEEAGKGDLLRQAIELINEDPAACEDIAIGVLGLKPEIARCFSRWWWWERDLDAPECLPAL